MARIRADYVFGTLSADLGTGTTTLSSAALTRLPVVASPDVAAITLYDGTNYEIVHVTAHTAAATTATILRAQEGTTARAWGTGATWQNAPTVTDFSTTAASGSRYFLELPADVTVDPTPSAYTLISGMTVTLPASTTARTAWVSFLLTHTGAHSMRGRVYVDGTGKIAVASYTEGGDPYVLMAPPQPVAIPGDGATHTIDLRWASIGATTAVTITERAFVVDVFNGSTSPQSI